MLVSIHGDVVSVSSLLTFIWPASCYISSFRYKVGHLNEFFLMRDYNIKLRFYKNKLTFISYTYILKVNFNTDNIYVFCQNKIFIIFKNSINYILYVPGDCFDLYPLNY